MMDFLRAEVPFWLALTLVGSMSVLMVFLVFRNEAKKDRAKKLAEQDRLTGMLKDYLQKEKDEELRRLLAKDEFERTSG